MMLFALCGLFAAAFQALAQTQTRDVSLPDLIVAGGAELSLNGAGVRREASFDRYVVALYLASRHSSLDTLLIDKARKRIALTFLRDTHAANLAETMSETIADNLTDSERESLKAPLEAFVAALRRLGTLRKGTTLQLDYVPGSGTQILLDGRAHGPAIRGADLFHALLQVWLGKDALDPALRRALLRQGSAGARVQ